MTSLESRWESIAVLSQESSSGNSGAQLTVLFVAVIVAAICAGWVAAISVVLQPASRFSEIGRSKAGWVAVVLLVPFGFVFYLMSIRPMLNAVAVPPMSSDPLIARRDPRTRSSAMPTHARQWAPDPYGRHGHRYFDGRQWTDKVADRGEQSVDPVGYPTPTGSSEGWSEDPFGRFPTRYYRGDGWTAHVARYGTTDSDPPDYPPPPSDASPAVQASA